MWGLPEASSSHKPLPRFTPTYVGTSWGRFCLIRLLTVHPHVCGDFAPHPLLIGAECGSPPRMWGLLIASILTDVNSRFTPTYVGTSLPEPVDEVSKQVHPHVCGDFFCI